MLSQFSRTELLLGSSSTEILNASRVAVFGIGGVGGFVVEALARAGIGTFDLIDNDTVSLTNINRQIIATHSTIGRLKTEAAAERLRDINPQAIINIRNTFFLPENAESIDFSRYDYVVDAIDTVSGKLAIIMSAKAAGVPVISSMGTGNKLDPTALTVADIYNTSVCPLARVMRTELKKRGVKELKVVYSQEKPLTPCCSPDVEVEKPAAGRRQTPGSVSFVPSAAGLIIAGEVIKDLLRIHGILL
ncbi:MAG: tRNA threonylcarbamoyladenosine dehydratase [Eubacteriales bacterium]|nr:tRNA threonylcarbamoyladenosine dehydratase [Eubacteriales bacterium]